MPLDPNPLPPVMALTQDGLALSHEDQARALTAAGVRWIQLRMKHAAPDRWVSTARAVVAICRDAGALCIINDSVDVALAAGADGVHLGRLDGNWSDARRRLGPDRVIGGTVNYADDARRAAASQALNYVGIGPFRFTTTKQNLAPVLGLAGIAALLPLLGPLPAWAIGGVRPDDLPAVRRAGLAGVAVSSSLYLDNQIAANYAAFANAWSADS